MNARADGFPGLKAGATLERTPLKRAWILKPALSGFSLIAPAFMPGDVRP